jgi:hypothetical protein
MNKHFLLSGGETARMLEIFKKNNVEIKFESFDEFHKSLNELYLVLYQSYCRNYKKHGYSSILFEHDMTLKKLVTYHKMYKYYYINYFDQKFIDLFIHIQESMSTWKIENTCKHQANFRSFDDEFAFSYDVDGTIEGYYFMVNKTLCPSDDDEIIDQMFSYFGYKESPIHRIIRKRSKEYTIQYLGYDTGKKLKKIGFSFNQKIFYEDEDVKLFFSNYKHFYDIVENTNKEMYVQFHAKNPKYICVEINPCTPTFENLFIYIDELVSKNILDQEQKKYIIDNKKTKQAIGSFSKFRWENEETFNVKWYNSVTNNEI